MTTGSTVKGLVPGMDSGIEGKVKPTVINVIGNPNGVVTGVVASGIAWDETNGNHYMFKTGETWIKLGSVA
jgi:hypothetical protein